MICELTTLIVQGEASDSCKKKMVMSKMVTRSGLVLGLLGLMEFQRCSAMKAPFDTPKGATNVTRLLQDPTMRDTGTDTDETESSSEEEADESHVLCMDDNGKYYPCRILERAAELTIRWITKAKLHNSGDTKVVPKSCVRIPKQCQTGLFVKYQVEKLLGQGACGTAYLVSCLTDDDIKQEFCIKVSQAFGKRVLKETEMKNEITCMNELSLMCLPQGHITEIMDSNVEKTGCVQILMPYVPRARDFMEVMFGETTFGKKVFNCEETRENIRRLATALSCTLVNKLIHHDLHAGNIMLSELTKGRFTKATVIDWSKSIELKESDMHKTRDVDVYKFGYLLKNLIERTANKETDSELMDIQNLIAEDMLHMHFNDGGVTAEKCISLLFRFSTIRCWKLNADTKKYVPVQGNPVNDDSFCKYTGEDRQFTRDDVLPVQEMTRDGDRYIITGDDWTPKNEKYDVRYWKL